MAFIKYVPNILTISRIFLSFFILYFISQQQFAAALIIILTAYLTDLMDGAIARRFNAVTKIGANILETAADASMIFMTVLGFVFLGKLPAWVFLMFSIGIVIYLPITKLVGKAKVKWIAEFYIQPIAYGLYILFVPIYLATRVFSKITSITLVVLFLISVAILKRNRLLYYIKNLKYQK